MKQAKYETLIAERRACRLCAGTGLTNPSQVESGRYDRHLIGPWSGWQGSLDAQLMVVGQDWGDVRYFTANEGREKPGNPTNGMLSKLLGSIGIEVGSPESPAPCEQVFLTNAVLCLKDGGLQAAVRPDWFNNCGSTFLRAQIELVKPAVIVGLGECAFGAVLRAFNSAMPPFRDAVNSAVGIRLATGGLLFAVYHCGARILNTHRSDSAQRQDWQRIRAALETHRRGVVPN